MRPFIRIASSGNNQENQPPNGLAIVLMLARRTRGRKISLVKWNIPVPVLFIMELIYFKSGDP